MNISQKFRTYKGFKISFKRDENYLTTRKDDRIIPTYIRNGYYIIFHKICIANANIIIGKENYSTAEWDKVYRSLDHKPAANVMATVSGNNSPIPELKHLATIFVSFQKLRHEADYSSKEFSIKTIEEALVKGTEIKEWIYQFDQIKEKNPEIIKRLAILLLFKDRN